VEKVGDNASDLEGGVVIFAADGDASACGFELSPFTPSDCFASTCVGLLTLPFFSSDFRLLVLAAKIVNGDIPTRDVASASSSSISMSMSALPKLLPRAREDEAICVKTAPAKSNDGVTPVAVAVGDDEDNCSPDSAIACIVNCLPTNDVPGDDDGSGMRMLRRRFDEEEESCCSFSRCRWDSTNCLKNNWAANDLSAGSAYGFISVARSVGCCCCCCVWPCSFGSPSIHSSSPYKVGPPAPAPNPSPFFSAICVAFFTNSCAASLRR